MLFRPGDECIERGFEVAWPRLRPLHPVQLIEQIREHRAARNFVSKFGTQRCEDGIAGSAASEFLHEMNVHTGNLRF
jgi:hypothetical protein